MSSIRVDKVTGKMYTYHNIPVGKQGVTSAIQCDKGFYVIYSENRKHPEDSWYNGRFIGDRYAVFKWVEEGMFYQQVSIWYERYGNAVRALNKIAKGVV